MGGILSAGIARPDAGIFSNGTVGVAAVTRSLARAVRRRRRTSRACAGGTGGESTLPRMIGRPSLALPMITTLELLDCASWSVASTPRQRR